MQVRPLSVLVIDVTDKMGEFWRQTPMEKEYDTIIEMVRLARGLRIPVDVVEMQGMGADCGPAAEAIRDVVPKSNRFPKDYYSAFKGMCRLQQRLQRRGTGRLLVMGFHRDICVLETVQDALRLGYRVVTSPEVLVPAKTGSSPLPQGYDRRGIRMLPTAEGVRELLRKEGERRKRRRGQRRERPAARSPRG